MISKAHILWFKELDEHDSSIVGEKGVQLGELAQAGFPIPDGFVISSHAYFQFLRENKLTEKIKGQLSTISFDHPESIMQVSTHIQKLIMDGVLAEDVIHDIDTAYNKLDSSLNHAVVTLRTSEKVFMNVQGESNLILTVKEAWASLFDPKAILDRHKQHIDHFRIGSIIVVQKMIQSEKSGLMFTLDPITNNTQKIIIEAIYGLSDLIIQGEITPDHYEVAKNDLSDVKKTVATQEIMLTRKDHANKTVIISSKEGAKQKLTKNQIMDLALLGKKLEKHLYFPQDIEWAIEKEKIFLIQTRSIMPTSQETKNEKPFHTLPLLLKGSPASPGIVTGVVKVVNHVRDLQKIVAEDILVTSQTTKEFLPAMKKSAAIVTDKGSRLTHAGTHARSHGIPAVVGTERATAILKSGMIITVNGTTGEIYKGGTLRSPITHEEDPRTIRTATKVYVTIDQSSLIETEKLAHENIDGIGLLDASFILKDIGTHPKAIIHDGRHKEFTTQLAEQLEAYCKLVAPRPVIYRISDLQTHDYRELVGGENFEVKELNPFLGFRGAARHIQEPEVLELELGAVKKVRKKNNLTNLWIMIPFVRTVQELAEMKRIITSAGLHRSPTFKIWMSIDLPANVLSLDKFIEVGIDGLTIGADHLTSLLLGTDKTNHHMAKDFDELNPAVLIAFEQTVRTAHKHHLPVSVYGQTVTVHPKILEKLVEWGITSISVLPEDISKVRTQLSQLERKLIETRHKLY